MNRTRFIPTIVMLTAAFVACVSMIYYGYSTKEILFTVLGVSVVFFIIGMFVRIIVNKFIIIKIEQAIEEDSDEKTQDSENASDETKDGDNTNNNQET